MSTSQHIKNELAQTASANLQDEMVRLQDPRAWARVQKFKDGSGVTIRDYLATGTEVSARVRERDGKVVDVVLMTEDALKQLRIKESRIPGRPWSDEAHEGETSIVRASEFAFGMSKVQGAETPCLLITPVAYFQERGEAWPQDVQIDHLLPTWLKKKEQGVYQTDGRDYESVAEALLDCGLIEHAALASYHEEQISLEMHVSHDQNTL